MSRPGFFLGSDDYRLPHPRVPVRYLLTVHAVVGSALAVLRKKPPRRFAFATALEDDITRPLQALLENRFFRKSESPRLDRRIFRNGVRAPEVPNSDGTHPAKKPDLAFFLRREHLPVLPSLDAIFAECKPVDATHPVGTDYCDEGVRRFVDGEYGWTMQEGLLIAYARRQTIAGHLAPALAGSRHKRLGAPAAPRRVPGCADLPGMEPLHRTTHARTFAWPADHGTAQPIDLYHSWHDGT